MYGRDIGSLVVYLRTSIGGEEIPLFSQFDEVGNFWQRTHVEIPITDTRPFQLIVEAVVGNGPLGNIAIDDTSFTSGCRFDSQATLPNGTKPAHNDDDFDEKRQFRCKDKNQIILRTKVCDFRFDCRDRSDEEDCGTCDFENSWCGFKDYSFGAMRWTRRAPTDFGPSVDHTFKSSTGHFLITELWHQEVEFDDEGNTND